MARGGYHPLPLGVVCLNTDHEIGDLKPLSNIVGCRADAGYMLAVLLARLQVNDSVEAYWTSHI